MARASRILPPSEHQPHLGSPETRRLAASFNHGAVFFLLRLRGGPRVRGESQRSVPALADSGAAIFCRPDSGKIRRYLCQMGERRERKGANLESSWKKSGEQMKLADGELKGRGPRREGGREGKEKSER